ncbi:hypothetical protein PTSG_08744 [Salpingoeca rosetta]|uniref:Uncharacterized protein n=1 Tax=Salpingoeca rosetta (strain ATCC 50818 / BSB-021) TaxID=946362 RepID=F2UKK2_SALR5|nr:uncharacterized protein PTSG_08744 [Salpingoeca rosetta]EGD77651.1 hypothetical protein PTSG_08744 [Salpingoeca rosetta]|eukprot:XP_004990127.1 hypothetical protein PTSG_08744 [Salpingoeca rosetta]
MASTEGIQLQTKAADSTASQKQRVLVLQSEFDDGFDEIRTSPSPPRRDSKAPLKRMSTVSRTRDPWVARRRVLLFLCCGLLVVGVLLAIPLVYLTRPTDTATRPADPTPIPGSEASSQDEQTGDGTAAAADDCPQLTCEQFIHKCLGQAAGGLSSTDFGACIAEGGFHANPDLVLLGACLEQCDSPACHHEMTTSMDATTLRSLRCWESCAQITGDSTCSRASTTASTTTTTTTSSSSTSSSSSVSSTSTSTSGTL